LALEAGTAILKPLSLFLQPVKISNFHRFPKRIFNSRGAAKNDKKVFVQLPNRQGRERTQNPAFSARQWPHGARRQHSLPGKG
jgi:hypothetical protein